jgi:cysteine sulfinate desulfinase/cysteine desulfurase-like protein
MSLLKQNGAYGMMVAHRTVFTKKGAIERYKMILETCYNPLTVEGAIVISDCQDDLVKAGFEWEEIKQIEIDYLQEATQ